MVQERQQITHLYWQWSRQDIMWWAVDSMPVVPYKIIVHVLQLLKERRYSDFVILITSLLIGLMEYALWIEKLYRTCTVHTCHWYSTLPLTYVHYISIKLAACTTAWMYVLCIYIISHAVSWCMWNVRRRLYIEESWKLKLFIVTNITNCLFEYWFWSTSFHMLYIAI